MDSLGKLEALIDVVGKISISITYSEDDSWCTIKADSDTIVAPTKEEAIDILYKVLVEDEL